MKRANGRFDLRIALTGWIGAAQLASREREREAVSPRFHCLAGNVGQTQAFRFHIMYISVNAVQPGRSREKRAIAAIRHLFLEEDADGPGLLAALSTRHDLPPPSYVLHSSPHATVCRVRFS